MNTRNFVHATKILTALVFCVLITGCSEDFQKDAAIDVTKNFVVGYYVSNDIQSVLQNTAERAHDKLESEWADIKKDKKDIPVADKNEPSVTYALLGAEKLKDYIYVVHWQINNKPDRSFKVDIEAVYSKEGWKITDFQEL